MFITLILPIILCLLPILFFAILIGAGAKINIWQLLLAIALGVICFFPTQIVDEFVVCKIIPRIYPTRRTFLSWVLFAELIKGIFLIPLSSKKNNTLQFLLVSMLAGLTFGCGQTIVQYLTQAGNAMARGATLVWPKLLLQFAFIDLINMACSGLAGMFILSAKRKETKWLLIFYPFVMRALFEFFNVKLEIKWFVIVVLLLALLECRIKYKAMSEDDEEF